jgi:hypothetical protein
VSSYRFLVDESSLFVGEIASVKVAMALDRLSEQLQMCRANGEAVGIISGFETIECRPGLALYDLLSSSDLPRDCRFRVRGLLDKCRRLDEDPGFAVDPAVTVDGVEVVSFALAATLVFRRESRAVAILALVFHCGRGRVIIADASGQADCFIVDDVITRLAFYRSIFAVENTGEDDFFAVAELAFPRLRFATSLTFRRFDGTYEELRSRVVRHLGALNDGFRAALAQHGGLSDRVSSALGIDVSLEGSTRQSERLMRLRDVTYNGKVYRCEWHSKPESTDR